MEKTVTYTFSKTTKNTYVFTCAELGVGHVYYLPKELFATQPSTVTVTIKA